MLHCSREEQGKNGKSRKREDEKRVSEGSCGGENGEKSGVR